MNGRKVLFLNGADFGSTGTIIEDIAEQCENDGWDTRLVVPVKRGNLRYPKEISSVSLKYEQGIYYRLYKLFGNRFGFAPISSAKVFRMIKDYKPDVVHINCINCYMVNLFHLFDLLAERRIPTVITNHAEFFYTGTCDHAFYCDKWLTGCGECGRFSVLDRTHKNWLNMRDAIQKIENISIVSVSPWVFERSSKSPIMDGKHQIVINNGVHTDIFQYDGSYAEISPCGIRTIFHPTARFSLESDAKGSMYILDLARKLPNVEIIVAGRCDENIVFPHNVHYVGYISSQHELASFYNHADLCVVTSKRETFNLPVAESLCCGTPVVGFQAGGPESIALSEYTEFCKFGDIEKLAEIIQEKWLFFKNGKNAKMISEKAVTTYSSAIMAKKYVDLFGAIVTKEGRQVCVQ